MPVISAWMSAQFVERFKREIAGRDDEQVREPMALDHDERRLPQGWRLVAGAVAILLVYGAWHLLSSSGDSSQPVPPAAVLNTPRPAAKPAPTPVVVPPQTAVPSPAANSPTVIDGAAPGEQPEAATPPPAAGSRTPATQATPISAAPPTAAPEAAVPALPPADRAGSMARMNRNPRVVLRVRARSHLVGAGPRRHSFSSIAT